MAKEKPVNKSGRVTKYEIDFISKNLDKSDQEIAEILKKNVNIIREHKKKILAKKADGTDKELVTFAIETRPWFKSLHRMFTNDEIESYKYEWNRIVLQFNEDISASEEMQITSLLETNILLSRNLQERKESIEQAQRLTKLIESIYDIPEDDRQPDWQMNVSNLEMQIASLRTASKSNTDERIKLEANKAKYLTDLKATRAARNVLETNVSWPSLLKQLDDEDFREREGRMTALINKATEKETARLQQPHQFGDEMQYPILTPELMLELQEKENMEDEDE